MKTLEELGISPAPWRKAVNNYGMGENIIWDARSKRVEHSGIDSCFSFENQTANHNMMVAAPELYECLREAVIEMCHGHACCGSAPEYKCNGVDGDCFVKRWRSALAKAAGEEVAE